MKSRFKSGENHPASKLTEEDVVLMRELAREGLPPRIIGEKFDVARETARKVIKRETWRHVE